MMWYNTKKLHDASLYHVFGDEDMSKYGWNFTLPESVLKTQAKLDKIQLSASALAMSEAWKAAVSDYNLSGLHAALNHYTAITGSLSSSALSAKTLLGLMDVINTMQTVKLSSVAASVLPLIDTSVYSALADAPTMKAALRSVDWSWLAEVYVEDAEDAEGEEVNDTEAVAEQDVTPEIRTQIASDITEVLSEPENMHITSRNKYLQWVKESPEHGLQFLNTLLVVIQTIFIMLSFGLSVWQARPVKDSQVYEEPTSTSSVVYNLTVENNVTIIGDVPYYYEVEFVDPETGKLVTGYIYKGNVTAEEPDETETHEEEIEPTEEFESIPDATVNQTEPAE